MLGGAQVSEACPVTRILVEDGKVQFEEGSMNIEQDGWVDILQHVERDNPKQVDKN